MTFGSTKRTVPRIFCKFAKPRALGWGNRNRSVVATGTLIENVDVVMPASRPVRRGIQGGADSPNNVGWINGRLRRIPGHNLENVDEAQHLFAVTEKFNFL